MTQASHQPAVGQDEREKTEGREKTEKTKEGLARKLEHDNIVTGWRALLVKAMRKVKETRRPMGLGEGEAMRGGEGDTGDDTDWTGF